MGAIMGNNLKAVKLAYQALEAIKQLQYLELDMKQTPEEKNTTFKLYKDLDRLTSWYETRLTPEEWKELRSSK
jgi:hypothetical protein